MFLPAVRRPGHPERPGAAEEVLLGCLPQAVAEQKPVPAIAENGGEACLPSVWERIPDGPSRQQAKEVLQPCLCEQVEKEIRRRSHRDGGAKWLMEWN